MRTYPVLKFAMALMVAGALLEGCLATAPQNEALDDLASDPNLGHFRQGPTMLHMPWLGSMDRDCASPTLLPNGSVMFFDGSADGTGTELYDPTTNGFSVGPSTIDRLGCPVTAVLRNGKVLVAGGDKRPSWPTFPKAQSPTLSEIYDPQTKSFVNGPMTIARPYKAIPLINGRILILDYAPRPMFEYTTMPGQPIVTTELYDPDSNTFTQGPPLAGLVYPNWESLPDGTILLIGFNCIVAYDPRTNSFPWKVGFWGYSGFLTPLPGGKVMISGYFLKPTTLLLDPITRTLTDGPQMKTEHSIGAGATATRLSNGKVLFAAGDNGWGGAFRKRRSSDLFDPTTNRFIDGPKTTLPHAVMAKAILLLNGKVLITDASGKTELYTP